MRDFTIEKQIPNNFHLGSLPHNVENMIPCSSYAEALEGWEAFGMDDHEIYCQINDNFHPVTKMSNNTWHVESAIKTLDNQ